MKTNIHFQNHRCDGETVKIGKRSDWIIPVAAQEFRLMNGPASVQARKYEHLTWVCNNNIPRLFYDDYSVALYIRLRVTIVILFCVHDAYMKLLNSSEIWNELKTLSIGVNCVKHVNLKKIQYLLPNVVECSDDKWSISSHFGW